MEQNQQLHNLRHSAAHLLAHAVIELYPDTKITIGPVTETGFFYDFLPTKNFKEEDLTLIENKMHEIAKRGYKIVGKQVSKNEALALFKDNQFKHELITGIQDTTVGIYSQGDFFDLCKGGHVDSIDQIKFFKLTSISGAYWRADRSGIALQRITGVAFLTQRELDEYFQRLEDLKLFDHRTMGRQLGLFSFHDEAPGAPFFHPRGVKVYNRMIDYSRHMQQQDYQEIKTPLVLNESLWKRTGHYDNYRDNMFFTSSEKVNYCVRPMNCPGAALLYGEQPHSYKELPLRLSEYGLDHRCELSGVLHGLFRVRAFTQDDAHIFCTPAQIGDEIKNIIKLSQVVYKRFGFEKVLFALSTRPEKSIGSDVQWQEAEKSLHDALTSMGLAYKLQPGEGAFYGPKIEMKIEDAMGREWQCGTAQVDFNLPERFELEYVDADQSRKRPVVLHRVIFGSVERFFGIVLENVKGHLPFWVAPIQMRILTITDDQQDYAKDLLGQLTKAGYRVEADKTGDQISAKIRRAQMEKIPWMLVLGKKEQENQTVTLRTVDGKQQFGLTLQALLEMAQPLNSFE